MTTTPKLIGIEPKHITYVVNQENGKHDALVVKELHHFDDKTKIPKLRVIEDYKRPFWITHKGMRNHQEKKDYEYARNCQRYSSTQLDMPRHIAKLLNNYQFGPNPPINKLARSPYLYGVDVSSSTLLKNEYKTKWPDLISYNTIAGGDIETNVHSKDNEIICMSVTCKDKAAIFYLESWISDIDDPVGKTHELANKYIGEYIEKRKIKLEVILCKKSADIVTEALGKLHQWKPDFFSFWNIDFDVPKMVETLELAGISPASVFSDPSVPDAYKYFYYKTANAQKVTASGKTMSINIEDRWNWVTHPATFQCIDAMPVYRNLRLAKGKDPSYALDYILKKELGITKLKFDQVQHLSGLRWHEVMQEKYKIEYGIYNIFDSITLELLDEKTNDLALNITMFAGNSDFKRFNSNPKRLCDAMHFWYLNRADPCVIGSSSDEMVHPLDALVVGTDDWILTLPSYMMAPNGLNCIEEFVDYHSLIYSHVADLDVVATYPRVSQLLNIARETVAMEFSRIKGVSEHTKREVGVNLTAGPVNVVEIYEKVLGMPSLDNIVAMFEAENGIKKKPPCTDGLDGVMDMNVHRKAINDTPH